MGLSVPTVEASNIIIANDSDNIRKKFKQRLQVQKSEEIESNPLVIPTQSIQLENASDNNSESQTDSEYETDSSSESSIHARPKLRFLNKAQREAVHSKMNKPSLDEEA